MKKRIAACLAFIATSLLAVAQQSYIDSLLRVANVSRSDTTRLVLYRNIARTYSEVNPDSAYVYADKALHLARKMQFRLDEGGAIREMGYAQLNRGNYPRSLQMLLSALAILEDPKSERKVLVGNFFGDDALVYRSGSAHAQRLSEIGFTLQILGVLYANSNNYEQALVQHLLARKHAQESGNVALQSIINMTMARVYLNLKKPDSALMSIHTAYEQALKSGFKRYLGSLLLNMARVYAAMGDHQAAIKYYREALIESQRQAYYRGVVATNLALADLSKNMGNTDSTLYYINAGLPVAYYLGAPDLLLRSYTALADYYKMKGNNDSTVKYQSLIIKINDSLFNSKKAQEFQNIEFDEIQRQQQIEAAKAEQRNKFRTYILLAGLGIFVFVAIILYRSSTQRKTANILLSRQKAELEDALSTLQTTQNQLIQSEKMASLGEMTAGIAHEIQNPLNFVNNFSELNVELVEELKEELEAGNREQALAIAENLKENQRKVNHHGKRADAIVKSMLQHSRVSSGKKEPTDLNALVEEYVRLAYHGLRAKDKSFNAKFETELDPNLGKVEVVSQDIGRVILNLVNNAFYAVNEKKAQVREGFEPAVTVSTRRLNGKVELRVRDNGNGVPRKALDKIFQPFFTTKPSGVGTGLGLSLSYDIVTKGHGGEMKVETRENEGSEFIVVLPAG
ncbi:MAG TPA: ATP-binding protein [Chitinophagaceae bacterium]|nr:ATP-binding protein [Chitinophagaceae bacterium]